MVFLLEMFLLYTIGSGISLRENSSSVENSIVGAVLFVPVNVC